MAATIIDGAAQAARVRSEVAQDAAAFARELGRSAGLATVLVGDDAGSSVYVDAKQRDCREVGIEPFDHRLGADTTQGDVIALLETLNAEETVDAILLQLPVPDGLDGAALTALIDPAKDADGLTPVSAGLLAQGLPGMRPCTPVGVMELLDAYRIEPDGARAVVIGRSNLVGKPLGALLLERNATVTMAHSRTRELPQLAASADILVAAVGRPQMIQPAWVKPGATVIDVGITRGEHGLVGDVAFDGVAAIAGALTPVPGGVGPMTRACLLRNTLRAARARATLASIKR
ncbi:MAG: bifunctional 5,10-methylenetetrahydrofolate dehydrogenase/5,10-methenyltetrahydrofolate cyclohydrolase [Solirubrobacteraceae bacterium]|nr:MAG: bifunctional methylenetetrahydrofolate dehydrogenase/methenyltetrahydrofolate cyclohydrolase [Solirubrobacterales bacterium]